MSSHSSSDPKNLNFELFFISFVLLFLELILIRWVTSEVRIFAYLKNFVLIACFLGIGIGCFQSKFPFKPGRSLAILGLIVFCVTEPAGFSPIPFKGITGLAGEAFSDKGNFWYYTPQIHTWYSRLSLAAIAVGLTIILFLMIAYVFNAYGRRLGDLFDRHPKIITAYSVNVLGSLTGSLAFVLLSYLETPPWIWFGLFFILVFKYFRSLFDRLLWIVVSAAIVFLLWQGEAGMGKHYWSPYQKLVLTPVKDKGVLPIGYQLDVNNTGYQALLNLSYDFIRSNPDHLSEKEARFGHYELPYHLAGHPKNILIVGGGTGNDAAAAIRHGIQEIDCVEIDPTIIKIGEQYHPEAPYAPNSRVHVINDDARAYFDRTQKRYDLIWFGLADSHTTVSGYTNLRLDHYLYTRESLRKARSLLTENGVLILAFEARKSDWVASRLHGLLTEVFGLEPLVFQLRTHDNRYGFGGNFYVIGDFDMAPKLAGLPQDIREFVEANRITQFLPTPLTTDDWPFLYLEHRRIPSLYILVSLAILLCFAACRRYIWPDRLDIDWKFLLMGAGFMLLEVQSVTKAGLLFGSTWIVNSFVISQVLVWILVANWLYSKWIPKSLTPVFIALFGSIALLYLVPISVFQALATIPRLVLSSLFLTLPVFLAGIIFIHLFSRCEKRNEALGSNLFGALIGGLLESLTLAIGLKALLIPTALFYFGAFIFYRRRA